MCSEIVIESMRLDEWEAYLSELWLRGNCLFRILHSFVAIESFRVMYVWVLIKGITALRNVGLHRPNNVFGESRKFCVLAMITDGMAGALSQYFSRKHQYKKEFGI